MEYANSQPQLQTIQPPQMANNSYNYNSGRNQGGFSQLI